MSHKQLTELATIAIENETANTLNFKDVVELFASMRPKNQGKYSIYLIILFLYCLNF